LANKNKSKKRRRRERKKKKEKGKRKKSTICACLKKGNKQRYYVYKLISRFSVKVKIHL